MRYVPSVRRGEGRGRAQAPSRVGGHPPPPRGVEFGGRGHLEGRVRQKEPGFLFAKESRSFQIAHKGAVFPLRGRAAERENGGKKTPNQRGVGQASASGKSSVMVLDMGHIKRTLGRKGASVLDRSLRCHDERGSDSVRNGCRSSLSSGDPGEGIPKKGRGVIRVIIRNLSIC